MDFDLPPPSSSNASPIADLSYRNYDGILKTRAVRWWIVAVAMLRGLKKNNGFWIVMTLIALVYIFIGIQIAIAANLPAGISNPFISADVHHRYGRFFFQAMSGSGLLLFAVALIVGNASIAADNKANALIVYLSKPITKGDYLLGKWIGVFLPIWAAVIIPADLLYGFCLMSYSKSGFVSNEPQLFPRMVLASFVPAMIHASLIIGCSAWSKTPRMAGAAYSAIYFITAAVAGAFWGIRYHGAMDQGMVERHLSVSGIIEGLMQNILAVTPQFTTRRRGQITVAIPPAAPLLIAAVVLVIIGIAAARTKIRAVEVVRG